MRKDDKVGPAMAAETRRCSVCGRPIAAGVRFRVTLDAIVDESGTLQVQPEARGPDLSYHRLCHARALQSPQDLLAVLRAEAAEAS